MNGVERSNDGVVLKRCPFCGGRVAMNQDDYGYYVSCSEEGCVVMTNSYAEKEAVEKWNTRKPLERVIKRLEDNSFWTEATFDEDGYCNDDSEKVIGLGVAIEIIRQELM